MAPRIEISEDEILDELRAAICAERPKGFRTVQEMADELKCSRDTVQRQIKKWNAEGRVESILIGSSNAAGARIRVPAYKLKKK